MRNSSYNNQLGSDITNSSVEKSKYTLNLIWQKYGIILVMIFICTILSILSPKFLTTLNIFNVLRQISMLGIMAMGLMFVILTGEIDLSVGAFSGLAGALYAGMSILIGVPMALVFLLIVVVCVGLTNGFLITRGKGIAVIVTLATMYIFYGITLVYTKGFPISKFPQTLNFLGNGYIFLVPIPAIVYIALAVLCHFIFTKTIFGRNLFAIGGNVEAADLCGIRVKYHKIITYTISALFAAIGGLVMTSRLATANPNAGTGEELNVVAACLLGGASMNGGYGKVANVIAGVIILGLISNGLNLLNIDSFFQYIFKGIIILFAVMMDQWNKR
jgi:ribose transport system permease protein